MLFANTFPMKPINHPAWPRPASDVSVPSTSRSLRASIIKAKTDLAICRVTYFSDASLHEQADLAVDLEKLLGHMAERHNASLLSEKEAVRLVEELLTRFEGLLPTKCSSAEEDYACERLFKSYDLVLDLQAVVARLMEARHV